MNLTKHFLLLSILVVVCVLGWSGCYTQLATSSDNPEPVINSPTIPTDQPPQLEPYDPSPTDPYYPPPTDPYQPIPPAGSTSNGTGSETTPDSPHRQSGYQRSSSTDQNNSRQADTTPPRTSWSPAPTPSAPTPSSGSNTRTSGSTRGGR